MKTTTVPAPAPKWVLLDAEGQNLGRLASKAAMILRGKHRVTFSPHQLCGDHIVIINAAKLHFPPKKLTRQKYVKHTGYLGHIRTRTLGQMMEDKPTRVLELAIKGMLSNTRLRPGMLKRLHVFADAEHTFAPQKPALLKFP